MSSGKKRPPILTLFSHTKEYKSALQTPVNGNLADPDRPYINANPSLSIEGSWPDGEGIEHPQREILAVIEAAGLTPSDTDLTQLLQAINQLIADAAPTSAAVTGFSNLLISTTGASATISITADEISLKSAAGAIISRTSFSAAINTAATGINGLRADSGRIDRVLYLCRMDGTDNCGWIDPSPSSPTVPSGVTHWKRIGWISTDSSGNKYPLHYNQKNEKAQLVVSSSGNVSSLPNLASGAAGSYTAPTYVAVSLTNKVPATAAKVSLVAYRYNTAMMVAPNNNYGAAGSATNPPPHSNQANDFQTEQFDILLESMNFYYASNAAASTASGVNLLGWADNL